MQDGLRTPARRESLINWIIEGSAREDDHPRYLNHFHNPLADSWRQAGFAVAESSILWGQDSSPSFRRWSWLAARDYFWTALTATEKTERDKGFADTFRALGQQIHLIQDAASPAHTRNDPHVRYNFESFVNAFGEKEPDDFEALLDRPHASLDTGWQFLPPNELAPIPIARLFDTDQYRGANPDVTMAPLMGLAEYVNANFFSEDRIFTENHVNPSWRFPYPRRSSVSEVEEEITLRSRATVKRRYFRKTADGDTGYRLATVGFLFDYLQQYRLDPFRFLQKPALDEAVYRDYAERLLPRAVAYSTAMLDYFFRGQLDVSLQLGTDPQRPDVIELVGTNASPTDDTLKNGSLAIYADDSSGNRRRVTAPDSTADLGDVAILEAPPGTALLAENLKPIRFRAPFPADRFVVVYTGELGNERKNASTGFRGGVIGQVLGGLRAESIFAQGQQRRLRTAEAIVPLPAETDGWQGVQWGDRDNSVLGLVPATPAAAAPAQVKVFEIQRAPGATTVPVSGPPGAQVVAGRVVKSVDFPYGLPLGATVNYTHHHQFKQQLLIVDVTRTLVWTVPPEPQLPSYQLEPLTVSVREPEVVVDRPRPFAGSFPIILDRAHLLGTPGATPYTWRVVEVTLDAEQRPLALVEVKLTTPPNNLGEFPTVDIDPRGARIEGSPFPVSGRFPIEGLLWALIDVERSQVLGVTSAAGVAPSITQHHGFTRVSLHTTTVHAGGPMAGNREETWVQTSGVVSGEGYANIELETVQDPPQGVQTQAVTGWYRLDLAPLIPARFETRTASVDTVVTYAVDPIARKNYQVRFRHTEFWPNPYLTFLRQGTRLRPSTAPSPQVLLLFGTPVGVRDEGEEGLLVHWSPQVPADTRLAFPEELPPAQYTLQTATPRAALVRSVDPSGRPSSLLFDLDRRRMTTFPGRDLAEQYVLLAPASLYNVEDTQFHTADAALARTPLPVPLAPGPAIPAPAAAYHLIQKP